MPDGVYIYFFTKRNLPPPVKIKKKKKDGAFSLCACQGKKKGGNLFFLFPLSFEAEEPQVRALSFTAFTAFHGVPILLSGETRFRGHVGPLPRDLLAPASYLRCWSISKPERVQYNTSKSFFFSTLPSK